MFTRENLHEPVTDRHHLSARIGSERKHHRVTPVQALLKVFLAHTHGGDFGGGENIARHPVGAQRLDRIPQNMRHSDAPLHRGNRGERVHACAVPRSVNIVDAGAGHPIDHHMPGVAHFNTGGI